MRPGTHVLTHPSGQQVRELARLQRSALVRWRSGSIPTERTRPRPIRRLPASPQMAPSTPTSATIPSPPEGPSLSSRPQGRKSPTARRSGSTRPQWYPACVSPLQSNILVTMKRPSPPEQRQDEDALYDPRDRAEKLLDRRLMAQDFNRRSPSSGPVRPSRTATPHSAIPWRTCPLVLPSILV